MGAWARFHLPDLPGAADGAVCYGICGASPGVNRCAPPRFDGLAARGPPRLQNETRETMPRTHQTVLAIAAAGLAVSAPAHASGSQLLVATVNGPDIDLPASGGSQIVSFNAPGLQITGVGLTARWTGVNADLNNGIAPWSTDVRVGVVAPGGQSMSWGRVGGDVSIADFPFQDASPAGLPGVSGVGDYTFNFDNDFNGPWIAGLREVQYHLTATVPTQTHSFGGNTAAGDSWSRPFFINGVSGLGPVRFAALEFTVSASGRYDFETIIPGQDVPTFLYQGGFDASQPLQHLLDYSLANGSGADGNPRGESRIDALLHEGETYHFVVSQWSRFTQDLQFDSLISGPGVVAVVPAPGVAAVFGLALLARPRRRQR